MRSSIVASFGFALFTLVGCAAETANNTDSGEDDVKAAKTVTGTNASALMDLLRGADAPSDVAPGILGVGGRIGRIELVTAQGGMAHFVSHGGQISTVEGGDLGSVLDHDVDWAALEKALQAGGAKWVTVQGAHGASSGSIFAKVDCKQVVAPSAKPTCTVTPISVTAADSKSMMHALMSVDAPSNTPPGLLGVGSRIAHVELKMVNGGMAKFMSHAVSITTVDGKELGDIASADTDWNDFVGALLDGGGVWNVAHGDHGSSTSTMAAEIECKQVVSPSAKPNCTVTPLPATSAQ